MPTFNVTAPDGRSFKLTGDSPPTEEELEDIFSKIPEKKEKKEEVVEKKVEDEGVAEKPKELPNFIKEFKLKQLGGVPFAAPQSPEVSEMIAQTGLGFAEGATGGLVRGAVEAATGSELDIRGNIAGRILGAASPVGLSRKAGIFAAKTVGGGVKAAVAAGAAGAAFAAPEGTRDPFSLLQRASAATVGAVGGFFIGGVGRLIGNYGKRTLAKNVLTNIDEIDSSLVNIGKDLEKAKLNTGKLARVGALQVQKRFRDFSRQASKGYETLLEKAENALPSKIKKDSIVKLLDNAISESEVDGITTGPVFKELNRLRDKMGTLETPTLERMFAGVKSGDTVDMGDLTTAFSKGSANEEVSLKGLQEIKRLIKQKMSGGFVKGVQRAEAEDVPGSIFLSKLGEFVEEFSPELAKANRIYKRVVDVQKKAVKIFKPGQGPLETKTGTEFIKSAAAGNLEGGESLFLKRLQGGIKPFTKGVGDVVSPAEKQISKSAALEIQKIDLEGKKKVLEKVLKTKNAGQLKKLLKVSGNIAERVLLYKILRKLVFFQ